MTAMPPVRCCRAGRGCRSRCHQGFSLLELGVVIAVITLLTAIAIPRFASFSTAADTNAAEAELCTLRRAIEVYREEHGSYPIGLTLRDQLTKFTDENGSVSTTRSTTHCFGPYVRTAPATFTSTTPGAVLLDKRNENAAKYHYFQATGTIQAVPK